MDLMSMIFPQVRARYQSQFNGEIKVVEFYGMKYLDVGGLMQSGRVVEEIFAQGLQKYCKSHPAYAAKNVLVLGLGGGSVLTAIHKYFPEAHIQGVEIDPQIIRAGREHFELDSHVNFTVKIADALDLRTNLGKNYDLIIVDMFTGYAVPQKVSTKSFLNRLRRLLSSKGIVVFNRLYFKEHKEEADQFAEKVRQSFAKVEMQPVKSNMLLFAS